MAHDLTDIMMIKYELYYLIEFRMMMIEWFITNLCDIMNVLKCIDMPQLVILIPMIQIIEIKI
jgi:hypothetical protein